MLSVVCSEYLHDVVVSFPLLWLMAEDPAEVQEVLQGSYKHTVGESWCSKVVSFCENYISYMFLQVLVKKSVAYSTIFSEKLLHRKYFDIKL